MEKIIIVLFVEFLFSGFWNKLQRCRTFDVANSTWNNQNTLIREMSLSNSTHVVYDVLVMMSEDKFSSLFQWGVCSWYFEELNPRLC